MSSTIGIGRTLPLKAVQRFDNSPGQLPKQLDFVCIESLPGIERQLLLAANSIHGGGNTIANFGRIVGEKFHDQNSFRFSGN